MQQAVVGIDVGTGSARAGVFTLDGGMLGSASRPICMWEPEPEFVEQSSDDIWASVTASVREALSKSGPVEVTGIGFDATCSLVVLDAAGRPLPVDRGNDPARNVIVWMDHRALAEAAAINATHHHVLDYLGGRVSVEMETPKLLWLKQQLPETWRRAAHFFDLPDYLTWRATGAASRSLCSAVCKWTYLGHEQRWDEDYFRQIGLGDIADEGFARIGIDVKQLGRQVGNGLSAAAALDFGLPAGIPVGVSAIDAHAGGIGVLGAVVPGESGVDLERRVALVGGTSSCHMAVSRDARFVPGVWGPYYSAMLPGLWLNEGGQSASGALIDHIITTHPRHGDLLAQAKSRGTTVYVVLNEYLARLAGTAGVPVAMLTCELHVYPDFHGNRSPVADPTLKGMISGLELSETIEDLARLYLATIQAVAYGTRHIIEVLDDKGYAIDTILACGGGTKNAVFVKEHADATNARIVLPKEPEAVLLGSAILGGVAGGSYPTIAAASAAMSHAGEVINPNSSVRAYHDAKYAVFRKMLADQLDYREIMSKASPVGA